MGGNKHGLRSGRYVGSFLQLFDWNAKSRKKLFSSKSDLAEPLKQGKKSKENLQITKIHVEHEEFGAGFSIKGGSDYSCASSVTNDDVYGTKAPCVVARLMGLDALPASNTLEPYDTPFLETRSLGNASFRRKDVDLYPDHQILHPRHLVDKVGSPPRKALDMRPQKMPNKPIEKFQTEILPPKSAKTIPITHHKLLSPIKSHIFVPSQDAAHIMEAAAKIIEPGPQGTPRKRISSTGSPSVPFKVRELKEKLEAAQRALKVTEASERPVVSKAAKYSRGQPMNKSSNGSSFRVSPSRDYSSGAVHNKGKSISLAIQAKVNVQKREGLTPSGRTLGGSEDQDETRSIQSFKSHVNGPTTTSRKSSTQGTSAVLMQNNQKQNSSTYREKLAFKNSITTSTGNRAVSNDISNGRQKASGGDSGTYRVASRKSRLQARDVCDKDVPGVRNVPRKKRSVDCNVSSRNQVTDNMLSGKHDKLLNCDTASDVVSFTFTAPIMRSLPGSEPARRLGEKSGNLFPGDRGKKLLSSDYTMLSLPGLNEIGVDSFSFLLEKKLKELTSNFETSNHNPYGRAVGTAETATGKAHRKKANQELRVGDMNNDIYSSVSSNEPEKFRRQHKFQAVEAHEEYNSIKAETQLWNDCHFSSPVSILEPFILTESCNSSESTMSSGTEESKPCSSVQVHEFFRSGPLKKHQTMETETDTLDSASSTSSQISSAKDPMKPTSWELAYMQDMLCGVDSMFKNYTKGQTHQIVDPRLFDQMERPKRGLKSEADAPRLDRKLFFDCVCECLDLKCQQFVGGGFELWAKGIATMKRKERLVEEVYKEIQGWRSLGKSMVDELVDKDMSSKYGRWVEFEEDEFMVGVEIEGQILDSLVLEIVADVLPL